MEVKQVNVIVLLTIRERCSYRIKKKKRSCNGSSLASWSGDRMWSHLLHRQNMEKEKLRPTRQKIARAASAATLFGPERGPR